MNRDVRVEPTDSSFKAAIKVAQSEPFDAFVAVGYVHVLTDFR